MNVLLTLVAAVALLLAFAWLLWRAARSLSRAPGGSSKTPLALPSSFKRM